MTAKSLPYLDTFAEAAERGSFTAAAHRLGVSQAAVSQRVHQLETLLNAPLFRRHAGRVTLTAAGRRLHEYARRILDLSAEARAAVTGSADEVAGDLVVAASSVPGQHLLPPALATFHDRHPAVRVRLTVSDTDAVFRELEAGHAHIGVVGGHGGGPHLEFRELTRDELVLVVPAGHPWEQKARVTLGEFLAQPLVQREQGSATRACLERALAGRRMPPSGLNVVLELGSNEAVKEAVFRGAGVAVLSRRAVEPELAAGRLRAVRVAGLDLDRDLFVVRDRRHALPAPACLFLNLLAPVAVGS